MSMLVFLRLRRPQRSTHTDTLLPDTTLFRSGRRNRPRPAAPPADGWPNARAAAPARSARRAGRSGSRTSSRRCGLRQGGAHCTAARSEEHTSELQSLMRISYAVFCLKKKKTKTITVYLRLQKIKTMETRSHTINI